MKSEVLLTLGWACVALASALPMFAKTLPPLPEPAFADGEVSQCYAFDQSGLGSIWLDLTATFVGTASNNLEIAFGQDVDHDGELSLPETDLILGWSCGCYFLERFKACAVYEEANVGTNDVARLLEWRSRVRRNGRPYLLKNRYGKGAVYLMTRPLATALNGKTGGFDLKAWRYYALVCPKAALVEDGVRDVTASEHPFADGMLIPQMER